MMDKVQLQAFLRPLLDLTMAGVDNDGNEYSGEPVCAEARAFLLARIGEKMPASAYNAVNIRPNYPYGIECTALLMKFFSNVADDLNRIVTDALAKGKA